MNCFPCFPNKKDTEKTFSKQELPAEEIAKEIIASSSVQKFNFRELAMATKNFRQECLLAEGGFGRVFKGNIQSISRVVAVKQLDRNGIEGNKEFLAEVSMLSLLHHPNLINLIGYCADGDQRLLVYEFMPMGSLENHLFGDDPDKKPLDWFTRMKIAAGAAKGLEYLHDKASPPIIYRDLKSANILLDENFEPKLSDFGVVKLGPRGGKPQQTSKVMGTYGYSAPEYSSSGELTLMSDLYSFGVVLLELITGRRVIDTTRPNDEQNLVAWAQPYFRDPKRFSEMADPRLNKEFPATSINQAVGIAAMCLQEEPTVRPLISDVVSVLGFISTPKKDSIPTSNPNVATESEENPNVFTPPPEQKMYYDHEVCQNSPNNPDRESLDQRYGSTTESWNGDSGGGSMDQENEASSHLSDLESSDFWEVGPCSKSESADDYSDHETKCIDHYDGLHGSDDGDDHEKTEDQDESGTKADDVILNSRHGSSKKSEVGAVASCHGSQSTTPKSGSKGSRHRVVKFREAGSNLIRSGSEMFEKNGVTAVAVVDY
ncbi:hypothetical protein Nepgr_012205 [Nepenthes gracilis]|uniref:Protein kinase domain-containing protein n=1 Tax=Nepenthes gracilis TaxID=150966 RepID=A0AAD3XMY1_NEPGR|nr:hypothetical protein Nepgr_012205 [Nepenthes gracilis]